MSKTLDESSGAVLKHQIYQMPVPHTLIKSSIQIILNIKKKKHSKEYFHIKTITIKRPLKKEILGHMCMNFSAFGLVWPMCFSA